MVSVSKFRKIIPRSHGQVTFCLYKSCLMFTGAASKMTFNTLRLRKNGCHFAHNIFKCMVLNENVWISLKFVPEVWINNIPALVQIMAWRRPGDKPLFEQMIVSLPMHICLNWPQWVHRHCLTHWHQSTLSRDRCLGICSEYWWGYWL